MTDYSGVTVRQAMQLHYARSRLPHDGGRSVEQWTLVKLGPFAVRLSNFEWRKRALPCHDLHHVLTGYACTTAGEFEIAAWEFAAGNFPNVLATLFCLPLVGLGAVIIPARSLAAFVRGRRSRTLYAVPFTADVLALDVQELRNRLLPPDQPVATLRDLAAYCGLVALSLALPLAVLLMLVALWMSRA